VTEKNPHQGVAADTRCNEGISNLIQEVIEAVFAEPRSGLKLGAAIVLDGLTI
jgi:hypothetical protein